MTCVGLVIVSNMYKIAISIQMLLAEVDQAQRIKRKRNFYICLMAYLTFSILLYFTTALVRYADESLANVLTSAGMTVLFTLVMAWLLSKLDRMQEEDLRSERSKTMKQYTVFTLGFII